MLALKVTRVILKLCLCKQQTAQRGGKIKANTNEITDRDVLCHTTTSARTRASAACTNGSMDVLYDEVEAVITICGSKITMFNCANDVSVLPKQEVLKKVPTAMRKTLQDFNKKINRRKQKFVKHQGSVFFKI